MNDINLTDLTNEISGLYEESRLVPFPHEGCRTLLREIGEEYNLFIPHLDLYLINIAGYCLSTKKVAKWSLEQVEKAYWDISKTFFEKHPQYSSIELLITESKMSDLYRTLDIYEKMRAKLFALLSLLLKNKAQ